MSDEIKEPEIVERKCFGLKESEVLKFVIPCFASFLGTILGLAVFISLTKPPVPKACPCPRPMYGIENPRFHHHHYRGHKQWKGDRHWRGDRIQRGIRPDRPMKNMRADRPNGIRQDKFHRYHKINKDWKNPRSPRNK